MKTHYTLPAALAALVLLVLPADAQAAGCPNEEFRTGPSASLPDCRAYELVTPEELGRTQAMTFTVADYAIPSIDGERLALETYAPLEPDPSYKGTRAVYARTARGWTAKSIVPPGSDASRFKIELFSPDLSQVALTSITAINNPEENNNPSASEVGPVGGPYALVADLPEKEYFSRFAGANAGTANVPSFTDVLLESADHQLLPEGPEREIAEKTGPGAYDLYDWMEGKPRLVNMQGEGSNLKALNTCGARLGAGPFSQPAGANTAGAVSADGSKIFFTSCGGLYMRVDGRETVEVSEPQGVEPSPSERTPVDYNGASADGSEVVFNTGTPLLAGETANENKLFIYNTVTHNLQLIEDGVSPDDGTGGRFVLVSENGSAVYYETNESVYRYETQTGDKSFVARIATPGSYNEPSYTTPNGEFLVFAGGGHEPVEVAGPHGPEPEPRGAGHNELYRYDAATGNVICVSCGEGVAPAEGEMIASNGVLETQDETPPFIQMSEDGQRVFFQTTAQLVPQDTNSTEGREGTAGKFSGMDVYEWEADGTEESPGVFCRVVNGCTHLLTTGEDVGKGTFLGASENGDNIFFATAGQLLPQVDGEFPNIYDARVDGGFPPPSKEPECLSCQGVGSPPPLFGAPASETFTGPPNAAASAVSAGSTTKTTKKTVKCGKGRVKRKGRCIEVKVKHGKKVKRASRGARR